MVEDAAEKVKAGITTFLIIGLSRYLTAERGGDTIDGG
jgi:hypothetical protein